MNKNTIAAIATPIGRGGIGVIRISGEDALEIVKKIFRDPRVLKKYESHNIYYGNVIDKKNNIIDEVLLIYMKKPRSYTAEDVVEIQSHSSPIVLRKILDLIIDSGAELAMPGEFTKRAFLNGRIDLTQAEAVIDIINARTKTSLDIAVSQIKGELKNTINTIIAELEKLQINIEAVVDFPDEAGELINESFYISCLKENVIKKLNQLEKNFNDSNIYRDGIKIVIAGPPNSGKSSLLNKLLNKEKSIVTSIPGTTRDIIEEIININGIPFVISDTAGIQKTDDYVEKIGIKKTIEKINQSDILLIMFGRNTELSDSDFEFLNKLYNKNKHKKLIIIENKIDLELKNNINIEPDIKISVLQDRGIDQLKKLITDIILEDSPENRDSIVPNTRHYNLIKKANLNCNEIVRGLEDQLSYDLIAIDLKEALEFLYSIIGLNKKIDILDGIFNSFCIGK